jgi:predicted ATPase
MLKTLRLQNFKGFVDEQVAFDGLTVLVGANASGKSNLLDAIRFLQGIALDISLPDVLRGKWEGGRQTWPGLRGGIADAARKGESAFVLESDWELNGTTIMHGIGVETSAHPLLTREFLSSSDVKGYLFDTDAAALREKAGRDPGGSIRVAVKRTGQGNSLSQTHSAGRSLLFQLDRSAPVSPDVERIRRTLTTAMREAYFLDITPSRMRDYVPQHASQLGLEGENVSALAWQLCQDSETRADLVDWLSELCAPELRDIDFATTELGDVMLVLVERDGRRIPARSLSDGTLRFLGELIALRTAPEGSLLLIEEIENGLHPTRTHLLVEAMEAAVEERGVQVLATSHSPLVLHALSERALHRTLLFGRPPDSEGTLVRPLSELPGFAEVVARRGIDQLLASGWLATVGKGRKKAMRSLSVGWRGLLQLCPEIAEFRDQLDHHLKARP